MAFPIVSPGSMPVRTTIWSSRAPAPQDRQAVRCGLHSDRARRGVPVARERRLVSRLPIRLRITLAFAGVMAVLLAALGLFIYLRFQAQLNEAINNGLISRAKDV